MKNSEPFICGVVEGFYGRPWSAVQRRQLFLWMRSWGMNTYLYAPKDDLKHRTCWRELYTDEEAGALKSLIRDCQDQGLNFIYAIAPGLDLAYANKTDATILRQKSAQMIALGCRAFALLFDDIQPTLSPEDTKTFRSVAAAQSFVANEFLRFLRAQASDPALLFCPTPYCRRMSGPPGHSDYLKQMGKLLDPAVQIFWTGPEIISETITVQSIRELRSVLRRRPLIWDNLHANDYDLRRIYLGPYSGRPLELRSEIRGILSNPNCEFEANYVPLRTLARYAQAGDRWDSAQAYRDALKGWSSQWKTHTPGGISIPDLELLGDCFHLPYQPGQQARDFLADLRFLLQTPPKKWGRVERRFNKTCGRIISLFEKMTALKNRELLYSLYRYVWELKEEVTLARNYAGWLKTNPGPDAMFASAEHRPKVYRGGLVAELQRLLSMDEDGGFNRRSFARAQPELKGDRAI